MHASLSGIEERPMRHAGTLEALSSNQIFGALEAARKWLLHNRMSI
jgi:hypothetical protein